MPKYIHRFESPEQLTHAFARHFAELVKGRTNVKVALSGGSTPKLLFRHWAEAYADTIDWSAIHFFWGDERCVAADSPESNYGVAKELFFDQVAVPPTHIHRIRGEADPQEEAVRYAAEIHAVFGTDQDELPVFDLVILGMGGDGHTASIFPNQSHLLEEETLCAVATHPESGQKRITLTGPVINHAASVAFLVTGSGKAERVKEVVERKGIWQQWPAAHIMPASGELHWFLDSAAAARLTT